MSGRRNAPRRDAPRRVRLSHWRSDGQAKTRYRSEQDANRASLAYRLEHGTDLFAYACSFCGGWHLGNQPDD